MEGIVVTQFSQDRTKIKTIDGHEMTAKHFIEDYFPDWSTNHKKYDILALVLFIVCIK